MTQPIYSVRKVVKEYQHQNVKIPVLRGINLDVEAGEIVSIVGHSGVGKSTLLNIMGLLDAPSGGSLMYHRPDEASASDLATLDRKLKARIRNREFGFVFQFYHLLPDLNVLENVLLPAMIMYSRSQYRSRKTELVNDAKELLDRVGIADRMSFPPSRLSGGERQRAAIARALINKPRVVFCDEPTGNLDEATGQRIHELILGLNESSGASFVIVTHDSQLADLAHRKLPMRDGMFVDGG